MTDLSRDQRRRLKAALAAVHPWLIDPEHGPMTVDAGECDRCGNEPRLVDTCGPVSWRRLGRWCAAEVGLDAWCDGHRPQAETALAWLATLPDEADDAARLWWVATGEVTLDSLVGPIVRALPDAAGELADFR